MGVCRCGIELIAAGGIGGEGLALLNTDHTQRVDHGPVAFDPGLLLDEAVEMVVVAAVVGDDGVEQCSVGVVVDSR